MHLRLPLCFLALAAAALLPPARATSVVPPKFPELVAEADAIYRGRVTAVEARRVARPDGGSLIRTYVTVAIDRTLKGAEQPEITLDFLGGTLGDETLEVSGVPKFTVGDRGIVFVQRNGRQFCPLVRLAHGTYRIQRDAATAREFVARHNHLPLNDVAEVQLPLEGTPAAVAAAARRDVSRALSPEAFEAQVVAEVQQAAQNAQRD
jgi:hypothetical protein